MTPAAGSIFCPACAESWTTEACSPDMGCRVVPKVGVYFSPGKCSGSALLLLSPHVNTPGFPNALTCEGGWEGEFKVDRLRPPHTQPLALYHVLSARLALSGKPGSRDTQQQRSKRVCFQIQLGALLFKCFQFLHREGWKTQDNSAFLRFTSIIQRCP